TVFKYVRRWYFYKDHIIGTGITGERSASGDRVQIFFVIDEVKASALQFPDEVTWINSIQQAGLHPKFWTRWYIDNWNYMHLLGFWLLFGFPVTIPLIVFHIRWVIKLIKTRQRKWIKYLLIFPVTILFLFLLSSFPGSF
ncbi:MAG: hypothetical protein AAFO02_21365, partial [Bacteroidota bacterium]